MAVPVHNMCMCMCVCIHVGVRVYVCTCACTMYVCTLYMYVCVHVCVCVSRCMCVCMESFPMLQCKWCPWYLYVAPISSREHCPIGTCTCTVVPKINIIFICAAQRSTTIGHCMLCTLRLS